MTSPLLIKLQRIPWFCFIIKLILMVWKLNDFNQSKMFNIRWSNSNNWNKYARDGGGAEWSGSVLFSVLTTLRCNNVYVHGVNSLRETIKLRSFQQPGPEVIKTFLFSTQLSMKFQMLIGIKISRKTAFSVSDKLRILFFLLKNVQLLAF